MSGGTCDQLEETFIKKLVIVECHGVTKTTRKRPYDNSVTVEYPTILTAHLGTQTTVCGVLSQQASRICGIVTGHINTYGDEIFKDGISVAELVRVLKSDVVDNGDGKLALFARKTPIKPKLSGDSFQNINLFCPGVRIESGPGKYPTGNIDGVWVCDLIGANEENPFSTKKITSDLFIDQLKCDIGTNRVAKDDLEYDQKLKKYSTKNHTWLTRQGGIVTYRDLVDEMKNHSKFPTDSTAILLATCRVFEDDPDDMGGFSDAVPSAGLSQEEQEQQERELEIQELNQRQAAIDKRRHELRKLQQLNDDWWIGVPFEDNEDDKRNAKKRGRGGSNKKRRYTKRKRYFKSTRKVNKLKIKKRRTRKYKNKK